jgi:lysozyme
MDSLNVVVDISHHNGDVDLLQAKGDGIVAVIQKATQGTAYIDPVYKLNKKRAQEAGLLWGAYHFGTGGDPIQQAEHFLEVTGNDAGSLLVLDLEHNPNGADMSLIEAQVFVRHIYGKTGYYPGLYSGEYIKKLLGDKQDPVLARCWFWLAQYTRRPEVPKNWPSWTLWQYTDGTAGSEPHSVKGIGRCDRDKFNGSIEELQTLWHLNAPPLVRNE